MHPTDLTRKYRNRIFGNFLNYYERKNQRSRYDDNRIKVLDQKYFLNRKCLDVGCNTGNLTLMIAVKYFP